MKAVKEKQAENIKIGEKNLKKAYRKLLTILILLTKCLLLFPEVLMISFCLMIIIILLITKLKFRI